MSLGTKGKFGCQKKIIYTQFGETVNHVSRDRNRELNKNDLLKQKENVAPIYQKKRRESNQKKREFVNELN